MGGGNDNQSAASQATVNPSTTANLFKPYQQFMPPEYSGNQPINNPTNILQAYMQNMPAFLNAAKPVPDKVAPVSTPDNSTIATKLANLREGFRLFNGN